MTPAQMALAAAGGLALLAAALWLGRGRRAGRFRREAPANAALSLATAVFLLVAGEAWFHAFPQSDNYAFTLSSKRWFARHWGPLNAGGYRDVEQPPEALAGRRVVLVAGDSFVAGQGIEDRRDRFPDRLQRRLGEGWRVVNLGRQGWSTGPEAQAIARFPAPAEVVVLAYHVNDIYDAAARTGYRPPYGVKPPSGRLRPLIEHSYVCDFVFWRIVRYRSLKELSRARRQTLPQCYFSPEIWAEHERELQAVVEAAGERGGELVVLLLPHLADVESSRPALALVGRWFESRGAAVVDAVPRLAGRDPREILVNRYDAHANEALNGEIAEWLAPVVRERAARRGP